MNAQAFSFFQMTGVVEKNMAHSIAYTPMQLLLKAAIVFLGNNMLYMTSALTPTGGHPYCNRALFNS